MEFEYRSELPHGYEDALERLVFFNPRQAGVQSAIVEALAAYGHPEIVKRSSGVGVSLSQAAEAQCLFAMTRVQGCLELAGVLVYVREADRLIIVHIAVSTCAGWTASTRSIARSMIRTLRDVAQRLRGVDSLSLFYGRRRCLALRRHGPSLQMTA